MNSTLPPAPIECDEFVTPALTPEQIRQAITDFVQVLRKTAIDQVIVAFGWGCELDPGQLWRGTEIESSTIPQFVAEAETKGIYRAGFSDLILTNSASTFDARFCHEAHMHFKSRDLTLLRNTTELWHSQNVSFLNAGKSQGG